MKGLKEGACDSGVRHHVHSSPKHQGESSRMRCDVHWRESRTPGTAHVPQVLDMIRPDWPSREHDDKIIPLRSHALKHILKPLEVVAHGRVRDL